MSQDDGQSSPVQSEKLSELEWDDHDQRSPVALINKGKNKAVPQFSTSDDIQMNGPGDSPPMEMMVGIVLSVSFSAH